MKFLLALLVVVVLPLLCFVIYELLKSTSRKRSVRLAIQSGLHTINEVREQSASPKIFNTVVFCTTCKGRAQHIKRTLPENLANNRDSKFVLLDYSSEDDLVKWLHENCMQEIKDGQLIVYSYATKGAFHMAHAKNMAARLGILEGAEFLVTLDADNFAGPDFAEYVYSQFDRGNMFLGANITKSNRSSFTRGIAGRIAIRIQDFLKAGGYDNKYDTWRGEDMDLNARLRRLGYTMKTIDRPYLDAVRHSTHVRFKEYPHAQQYETDEEVKQINKSTDTVVNYGDFGCGTVYRNFDSKPIVLNPIPTRIFGIGLHKTATSSLHSAFQILGYDSLHWGIGHAPKVWEEMNKFGTSKTLELFYAACDLPIPLLYKQLDVAYPGSKFILTVRDESDWVKSVERLWDKRYNPTRWEWDVYPFSNRIHEALYGTKDFHAETMLTTYRKHNAEVREYFKNRPNDLLVMDMTAGAGWNELCPFLDMPTPEEPYPRDYATIRRN